MHQSPYRLSPFLSRLLFFTSAYPQSSSYSPLSSFGVELEVQFLYSQRLEPLTFVVQPILISCLGNLSLFTQSASYRSSLTLLACFIVLFSSRLGFTALFHRCSFY
jgi:hypothetical protein